MKLAEKRDILAKQHAYDYGDEDVDGLRKAYVEGWDRAIVESRRKTSYGSLIGAVISVILQEVIVWLHLKILKEKEF